MTLKAWGMPNNLQRCVNPKAKKFVIQTKGQVGKISSMQKSLRRAALQTKGDDTGCLAPTIRAHVGHVNRAVVFCDSAVTDIVDG